MKFVQTVACRFSFYLSFLCNVLVICIMLQYTNTETHLTLGLWVIFMFIGHLDISGCQVSVQVFFPVLFLHCVVLLILSINRLSVSHVDTPFLFCDVYYFLRAVLDDCFRWMIFSFFVFLLCSQCFSVLFQVFSKIISPRLSSAGFVGFLLFCFVLTCKSIIHLVLFYFFCLV